MTPEEQYEFYSRPENQEPQGSARATPDRSPAAVMMSPDDLESLEETLAVINDREAVAELAEAYRACAAGDVVRGVEAVRALRSS